MAARHGQIDAPFVHLEGQATNRRHAIHKQKRIVEGFVHHAAQGGDVRRYAGCGFVVGDENGLDLALAIGAKTAGEFADRGASAPRQVNQFHLQPKALGHLRPQHRKLAVACHQHAVARRQGVGDGGFPRPRPRSRKHQHMAVFGAEQ